MVHRKRKFSLKSQWNCGYKNINDCISINNNEIDDDDDDDGSSIKHTHICVCVFLDYI